MDFEILYKEYSTKIYKLCLSYVNDSDKAFDLTQETFLTVYNKLHTFRNESEIGTWIYRIACNKCLRQIEADSKVNKAPFPKQLTHHPDESSDEQKLVFLRNIISQLPELEKLIIGLYLEDVPQEKISAIVGLSHSNVRVKIHRIKEKLTRKFNEHGQF